MAQGNSFPFKMGNVDETVASRGAGKIGKSISNCPYSGGCGRLQPNAGQALSGALVNGRQKSI